MLRRPELPKASRADDLPRNSNNIIFSVRQASFYHCCYEFNVMWRITTPQTATTTPQTATTTPQTATTTPQTATTTSVINDNAANQNALPPKAHDSWITDLSEN